MTSPGGPEEGIREFCEAEYPRLAGYCLGLTGDRQLARDLAQEAFVRVLGRWRSLSHPRPYLYVTATNLARRTWRRAATERAALDVVGSSAVLSAADPADAVVIRALAEGLPRHLRVVTILYYFADLPVEDIATGLKLPVGTVKRRLSDARRQLHQALSEGESVPAPKGGTR